jgi:rhodanese-related sulfurtransferase
MRTLTTDQLQSLKKENPAIPVVNVLNESDFNKAHIPRSKNIPFTSEGFVESIEKELESKDDPVIVYCASKSCDLSPRAAQKLEKAGFTKVYDYEGGMQAWKDAGLPIERN